MSDISNNFNNKQQEFNHFESLVDATEQYFSHSDKPISEQIILVVSIASQQLYLIEKQSIKHSYTISSAAAGNGNLSGSYQTPLGVHQISEKFGEKAKIASIFKARKNTHAIAEILTDPNAQSPEDNITSRILWLDGLEKGINRGMDSAGNNVDSKSRYIYIHGTDEEGRLGQAASHGCIRMANQEIIELFDKVNIGCLVVITED